MDKMFELEQKILQCWNITDDLRHLLETWDDTTDDNKEHLQAIYNYYTRKFENMWTTFEKAFSESCESKRSALEELKL